MIQFQVLGSLDLRGSEGAEVLSVLSQPKRTAILAYLAVASPAGFHRRDKIAGLFWPESDQERARASLRRALHHLRQSLGEGAILNRGDEEIGLNWEHVTCDAVEFQKALDGGDVAGGLEFYAGDLLEGFFLSGCSEFDQWLAGERERLREMAAVASWELAHRHLEAGRITDGERMGQKALGLVSTDENEVQRFLRALDDVGDRAAAVRFYEKFARQLKEALDLRPSAGTRALAEEIRNTMGHTIPSEGRRSPPEEGAAAEGAPPPRPSRLLQRVRDALADRYAVENEIGGGSLATVFLAEDLTQERKVALKVLAPELAETLGAERFVREIRTAANLTHPHILPVFDAGEADGFLFYVMPYVKGESLRSRLTQEKQLPVEDAIQITSEIADALAYAHEEGVVHRDVKPANILLEAGHAVLADFGVAHALADTREGRITGVGTSLGTPAYMSPEQITGERDLDGRSDQYGLGCVLYEMLAGEPPFTGPTAESVTRQHLSAEPPLVTRMRPSVGDGVARVIQRALSKNPADRFRTAGEMAAALALTTSPVPRAAVGVSKWYRAGMAVVFVVALIVLGIWMFRPGGGPGLDPRVVAVMPFENLTGNPGLDYLGQMASHFLTQELAKTRLIETRTFESVFPSDQHVRSQVEAGADSNLRAAFASEVGAGTIIHGTFLLSGGQLLIDASIDDVASGKRLRSIDPVSGDPVSPSLVIDELRSRVMGALAMEFDPALEPYVDQISHSPTAEAAQEFAIGARLYLGEGDREEAAARLLHAHELDPTFYSALFLAYHPVVNLSNPTDRDRMSDSIRNILEEHQSELTPVEQAYVEAWRALDRDDLQTYIWWRERSCDIAPGEKACYNLAKGLLHGLNNPKRTIEVFTSRLEPEKGWMRGWSSYWLFLASAYILDGDYERALEVAEEGRGIYPRHRRIFQRWILALAGSGRVDEALAFLEDSLPVLTPNWSAGSHARSAGTLLHHDGFYEEAERAFEFAVEWYEDRLAEDPDDRILHHGLASSFHYLGRLEEAEDHWRQYVRLNPASAGARALLGMVAAERGDHEEGRRVMEWLDEQEGVAPHNLLEFKASIAVAMGNREEAMDYLNERWRGAKRLDYYSFNLENRMLWLGGKFLRGYKPFEDLYWPRNH